MDSEKPSHSEVRFSAFLSYCPRTEGSADEQLRKSRLVMLQVKENRVLRTPAGDEPMASVVARRLRERDLDFCKAFLNQDTVLVPVPRSGLSTTNALWPALEIAESLRHHGFGRSVQPYLKRVHSVPKAATSRAHERPKAHTHLRSLSIEDPLSLPAKITLVDDVITRGAQLFGAAGRTGQNAQTLKYWHLP